ncbi:MAG: sugar ABC transporter ATP-binding protein, partial [Chloroflexota bacterium]
MSSLFTIKNASKSYGDVPALVDAALALQPGEVHALVGENGAGKSTLIKIMAGVVAPDTATFTVNGETVQVHNPQDALHHGMRFIHQELSFVPELSVAENVLLGQPYPQRFGILVDWDTLNRRAARVLHTIGIDHIKPNTIMARLRTGDQMLVRIASAFAGDDAFLMGEARKPKIYVMDEPTAALTGAEVDMLFAVIRRLRDLNDAVLYVSHRLDEIFEITDTTTVMRNGSVVATQPTRQLSHDDIIQLMTGRELEDMYPSRTSSAKRKPLLNVIDLRTKSIKDVSFTLGLGEILGVTGLRASGQTDLLRAVVGIDRATSGDIQLDGDALPNGTTARWEAGITYVPRERRSEGLVMSRSVRDNMVLPHLRHLARGGVFVDRGAERDLS